MSDDIYKRQNSKLSVTVIGALIGIVVTLLLFVVFSGLILLLDLDRAYSIPLATVGLGLGSFAAAFYVAKKTGKRGYLIGILVGLISFALVTIISLIVNNNGLTINTLFHFIIIVLASAIGGISGVNRGKDKKYI